MRERERERTWIVSRQTDGWLAGWLACIEGVCRMYLSSITVPVINLCVRRLVFIQQLHPS